MLLISSGFGDLPKRPLDKVTVPITVSKGSRTSSGKSTTRFAVALVLTMGQQPCRLHGVIGSLRNMVAGVKEGVIGKEKRLFAAVRSPDKKTTHLMLLKSEEKEHLTPDIGFTSTHGFEIPTLEGVCITKLSDEVFRFTPKTQIHEPKEHKAKKIMGVVFRGEEVTMIRLRRIDPE